MAFHIICITMYYTAFQKQIMNTFWHSDVVMFIVQRDRTDKQTYTDTRTEQEAPTAHIKQGQKHRVVHLIVTRTRLLGMAWMHQKPRETKGKVTWDVPRGCFESSLLSRWTGNDTHSQRLVPLGSKQNLMTENQGPAWVAAGGNKIVNLAGWASLLFSVLLVLSCCMLSSLQAGL